MEELTDFSQLQELVQSILESSSFSFSEMVSRLQSGDFSSLKSNMQQIVTEWITKGDLFHASDYAGILCLVLLLALMRILGQAFENKSITAFSGLIFHLLLVVQLSVLFQTFQKQAQTYLEQETTFTSTLFPVLAVAAAAGGESIFAAGTLATAMSIISLVSRICLYVLLPVVSMYLVLSLLDSLLPENLFSGITGILRKGMTLMMKSSLAAVSGLQLMQRIILPKADSLRRQTLLKAVSMIPGVGNTADTAASVLWESSSLLKGSIGIAGMSCIILIALRPTLQIMIASILYHILSAIIMPVADKKTAACLSSFAESLEYLVKITCLCAVLLLLTVGAAAA